MGTISTWEGGDVDESKILMNMMIATFLPKFPSMPILAQMISIKLHPFLEDPKIDSTNPFNW